PDAIWCQEFSFLRAGVRGLFIELQIIQVDIFHALRQLITHAWEATAGTATHLVLELLQLFHGWHSTTTRHAWHTRHLWHATAAVGIAWLFTLAIFTLAALRLLLRRRTSAAAHAELASHLGHHLLCFIKAFDELVDIGYFYARTDGNTLAARGIEDLRIRALCRGHTANDGLDAVNLFLIDHVCHIAHLLAARHHLEQVADGSHLADHQQLVEEVIEG